MRAVESIPYLITTEHRAVERKLESVRKMGWGSVGRLDVVVCAL